MNRIDLNADLGEGMAFDAELLDIVSSASVACGGHAGSETIMRATLLEAKSKAVVTGAHPGFADPAHFGRRRLDLGIEEIRGQISSQMRQLAAIAREVGQPMSYVKLHGALYNMASTDLELSRALFETIREKYGLLPVMALDDSEQVSAAMDLGLPVIREAFADRRYAADGQLVPRSSPAAVISDTFFATAQAVSIARDQTIIAEDGSNIASHAQSICLHGDNLAAVTLARSIRAGLEAEGIAIAAAV